MIDSYLKHSAFKAVERDARFETIYVAGVSFVSRRYRVFSLTWPASMQIFGTKESVYIRKEFNSHGIDLIHQHGRRFVVLERQYGRRDVM